METAIVSVRAKREYVQAIYARYRRARRPDKGRILDEFCAITRCHRKHALRVLNGPAPGAEHPPRHRPVQYGPAVIEALRAIWEAAGYPWSLRLKALLPLWLPWARRRLRLRPAMEQQLQAISPRQIDRRLAPHRRQLKKRRYGWTKPGSLLKHHITLRTDRWDVAVPGFTEIDLVAHCGSLGDGEFVHSLNVTDIHTTWVETASVLGKSQVAVQAALEEVRQALPFRLRGIDSDNGSEFINQHLWDYCQAQEIQFTRGRPYKKDDNAHIEQKNWTHVRKLLGYVRYDSPAAHTPRSTPCTATSCDCSRTCSCPRSSCSARSAWAHGCDAGTRRPAPRWTGCWPVPRSAPRSPRNSAASATASTPSRWPRPLTSSSTASMRWPTLATARRPSPLAPPQPPPSSRALCAHGSASSRART
jgi:hypothetical protein